MSKKLRIKKGDNVVVIAGDSRGQQGRVLFVEVDKDRAIVEGVNMVTKHSRPTKDNPKGGILKKEAPIHISNLKVLDATNKPTRVGRKLDEKTNKIVRYSKKTGEVIK
jgi:large subunit ribosomal protein L24